MKTVASIRKELENLPVTNHWAKGVKTYAIDMFEEIIDSGELVFVRNIKEEDLLDGAKNWTEYSWHGRVTCYDHIIRKILDPNDSGEQARSTDGKAWLDVQAEALAQVAQILLHIVNEECYSDSRYNHNMKLRDEIIFGEYNLDEYSGDCRHFENLTRIQLIKLLNHNFISMEERHNDAPTVEQFLEFMSKYPGYVASGYVISDKRSDYRVSITGLKRNEGFYSQEERDDFYELFKDADDFEISTTNMFCWFD